MSLNRSTGISKQLSKAAGESLVAYKLPRRGWLVVNANSGVQNMPNFDLIAMNPNAVVPTMVHDGEVLIESSITMVYTDDPFGDLYDLTHDPDENINLFDDPQAADTRVELMEVMIRRMMQLQSTSPLPPFAP